MTSPNANAPGEGRAPITKLAGAGGVKGRKKKPLFCGDKHSSKLRKEIQAAGLDLTDASGQTQLTTLPRVLSYLGTRGLNTPEAVGLGYLRIATRCWDLQEDGYLIDSRRESIIGADGLVHVGVARYFLIGRAADDKPVQASLDLGGAQ